VERQGSPEGRDGQARGAGADGHSLDVRGSFAETEDESVVATGGKGAL